MAEKHPKTKAKAATAFSTYRTLWRRFLSPHRGLLALAVFCGAAAAATAGFGLPMMMDKVFPVVFGEKPLPEFLQRAIAGRVPAESVPALTMWCAAAAMPLLMVFRGAASFANTYLISKIGLRVLEDLRLRVFARIQELPLAYHDRVSRGDLMATTVFYTQNLQQNMLSVTNDLVIQPLTLLAALAFLAYQSLTNNEVGLLLLNLLVAAATIPAVKQIGKKIIERMKKMLCGLNDIATTVQQNLSAQREVRSFCLEKQQTELLRGQIRAFVDALFKLSAWRQALTPIIEILSVLALSFSLFMGVRGGITLTQFTAIALALYYCYDPIKRLGEVYNTMQLAGVALAGVDAVLYAKDEMPEPENPAPLRNIRGDVEFSDVSFAYVRGRPVLKNVSVRVPAGQIVALVGPSGSGKTTFINLLCRFYDPSAGTVKIDGRDLRGVSRADRTAGIGLVSQSPVLFRGTVRDNIRIGDPAADDAAVFRAGALAAVDEFVRERPEGYDRMIGEGGEGLSGGQRQRVSVARAFLKNAPILVLDEATASLDMLSEEKIQQSLESLTKGRTTFIIAHRFSTIRRAQRILVFEEGRVVADGPHAALYASSPLYRELYDRQVADAKKEKTEGGKSA